MNSNLTNLSKIFMILLLTFFQIPFIIAGIIFSGIFAIGFVGFKRGIDITSNTFDMIGKWIDGK